MRRTVSILLVLLPASVARAQAQVTHRAELTLDAGTLLRAPDAFIDCHSTTGLSFGVRGGLRLSAAFLAEASVESFGGLGSRDCIAAHPPGPPVNGTTRISYTPFDLDGYPVLQTGLRMAWIPIRKPGQEFRLSAGIDRAWQQGLWVPTMSVSRVSGHGPVQLLLDAGAARYSLPLIHVTTVYAQGQQISSTSFTGRVAKVSPWLRVGMVIRKR